MVCPEKTIPKCTKVILCDIAGTTTSIEFIKDVLFKFASDNIQSFLELNWNKEEVQHALKLLSNKSTKLEEAVEMVKEKTNKNEMNEGLKVLQGLLYQKGYEKDIRAHVFPDVFPCFQIWSKKFKIAIYSTGSVESQKLLFANTIEGNLSEFIDSYFDLLVGSKTDSCSYSHIAKNLNVQPQNILFLTDSIAEVKAAEKAGCQSFLVVRSASQSKVTDSSLNIISSFDELKIE
ncbi:enolase-phosphatase E1 isoform X2 [Agrilus planipennis]|nr:enolase-phosphatase E1 isoform X2 [Agrilus planipennis]